MIPSSGQNGLSRFESRRVRRPFLTSSGIGGRSTGTSSRSPRNTGARRRPSRVHSAKVTSAANRGSTHVTSAARTRGMRGVRTSGAVGRTRGRRVSSSRSMSPSARPEPTFPAQCRPSGSRRARTRAPSFPRFPVPRVYPTIGRSSWARSFTFCHSGVRRPGRYGASARLATTPSSCRSRAAWSSASPSSNAGETRTASTAGSISSSRSSRRSRSGRSCTGSPSSESRSKTISTRGPEPDWSASKRATPSSSSAQTSASRTASGERTACPAARATGRKRSVRSVPFRLVSVASPPATVTIARYPSHFGSKSHSGPVGSVSTGVASCAANRVRVPRLPSFRRRSQFCSLPSSRAGTSVQTPSARSPARRNVSPPSRFSSSSS